jgi:lipopolysaccharide biosynthesis glycosyltransferase
MTIRALINRGYVDGPSAEPREPERELSIGFALDSGYLLPFKVMLASMARVGTLLDCPVVVYTDDERLLQDPVVQMVADKSVLVSGTRRDILYDLARHHVKRQGDRRDWNRGTFLKWAIFEPQPTPNLLFLDVDMIVLHPLEGVSSLGAGASLLTAPQFQPSLWDAGPEEAHDTLRALVAGTAFPGKHAWRINSGMMLVRKEFLDNAFFNAVTAFAKSRREIHEQAHFSEYFRSHPGHQMVGASFNFQVPWLSVLTTRRQEELLKSVKILHFAGNKKPWNQALPSTSRDAGHFWHEAAKVGAAFVTVPPPNADLAKDTKVKARCGFVARPGRRVHKRPKRRRSLAKRVLSRLRVWLSEILGR